MGSDGTHGAQDIVAAGGSVIAQDEATSVVWGMPGAAAQCRALLGGAAARRDRAEGRAAVPGRQVVTPLDYDYLRKLLKERSGLVLSADKQYLVESRLLPVARKAGLASLGELVAKLKGGNERADRRRGRGDDDQRVVLLPRQDPVRAFPRRHHAGADGGARDASGASASGARPPRPARSPIRSPCA